MLLCLLGSWAALAFPWLSGHVTIPWDAKAHFLPQLQFLAGSLDEKESPFWAPFVFSGHPQIADPQSLIFAPVFLLVAFLRAAPGLQFFDATVFVSVLLGQIGILLYGRERGWHWAACLVGAIAFGFGASMAWRIQHVGQVMSLSWFALTLWLLEAALLRASWRTALVAGLAAGFLLCGRDQVALLCCFLLALRVVGFWVGRRRPAFGVLFPAGIVAVLVAAVPLVLTLLFAAHSNRPEIDLVGAGRGSLHPAQLLTALVPDLFGASGAMADYWGPPSFAWPDTGLFVAQNMGVLYLGAAPLLLVLLGVARGGLWRGGGWFPIVGGALMLLYALGWYTPVFGLMHEFVPGVSLFRRPADAVFPLGALAALAAGHCLHVLLSDGEEGRGQGPVWLVATIIVVTFVIAIVLAISKGRFGTAALPLATALAALLVSAFLLLRATRQVRHIRGRAAGFLVLALILDLGWHNRPNGATGLPPESYEMLDPASRDPLLAILKERLSAQEKDGGRVRVELTGLGFAWPNASMTHRLDNVLGYNPVRLEPYSSALRAGDHVALPDQRQFGGLFPSYRSLLADLLGLRYIATGIPVEQIDKALPAGALELIAATPSGLLYENRRALPRVLLVGEARGARFRSILDSGRWPDFDPRRTVLLEQDPGLPARPGGTARIVSYRNTEIRVETDSPSGGWLVLNDPWQSWWFAELDGTAVPVLRANVLFRAVAVPPGEHGIRFHFAPLRGALAEFGLGSPP